MAKLKSTVFSPLSLFRDVVKRKYRTREPKVGDIYGIRSIFPTYFAQKRPLRFPIFRGVEKARRGAPPRLPPGRRYREYSIWELPLTPFAMIDFVREEVEARAPAEMMEDEIRNLKALLEAGEITEEEYQRREKEIRAKYEKR